MSNVGDAVQFVPSGSDFVHDGDVVRRGHGWVYVRQRYGKQPGRVSAVRQSNIDANVLASRGAGVQR